MTRLTTRAAIVFIVLSGHVYGNEDDVSIKATPQASVAVDRQAYIRVIIRIKKCPENRNLIFRWESEDGGSGRKDRQLDGEDSSAIFDTSDQRFFGRHGLLLPPGHYTLTATVERAATDDPSASTKITILEGGLDGGEIDR